jgi:eukaryotic-like serine/threonine-protein kinase
MSPDLWPEVEALLDAALDLPPDDRAALLDDPGSGRDEVRDEARRLLAALDDIEVFLGEPAADFAAPLVAESERKEHGALPERVGAYRVIREIGRGGMGAVYLAERDDAQFRMQVALKLVPRGMDSEQTLRRFWEERQILATLQHPQIARLLDGGVADDGRPWFAMEYVEGVPIDRYCEENALGIDARLRLFCRVCEAVEYAHRTLVVHRDLKPSNIMVTGEGEPKLLDFGIAKLLQPGDAGAEALTRAGMQLMTPEYASPEQVRGEPITTASDVYALGVVLYELLTGQRPYGVETRTPHELERAVCETDPAPPSVAVRRRDRGEAGRARPMEPAAAVRRARRLSGDIDHIVLKALRKEPEHRYASVATLREDVLRHLDGFPVRAREGRRAYRLRKFVRRHRVPVAAAALVFLSLAGGVAAALQQARLATAEAERAEEVRKFLVSVFTVSDPNLTNSAEVSARELLDQNAHRIETELRGQPLLRAEMQLTLGGIYRRLGLYDRAAPLLEGALDTRRTLHGARHAAVAEALEELGLLAEDRGRPEEAEALHGEALAMRRTLFRESDPRVARSMRQLASVLGGTARYDEAEALLTASLETHRRAYGPEHTEVALDLGALATLLRARGEYDRAVEAAGEALRIQRATVGSDHLETATAMNNLALLYRDRGRLDPAAALFREVLDFDIHRLGEEHRYTVTVMNNLASVLREQGGAEEAERMLRRVVEVNRRLFPDAHPFAATALHNLASVLRELERYDESEALFREALTMFRGVYGDEHPSVGTAHAVLAGTLHARGDHREAERHYGEALARLERSVGGAHPRTAAALLGYGRLLTEIGRPAGAETLLRRAVEVRRERLGPDHWQTADAEGALGIALARLGRRDEAGPLLRAALEAMRPLRGLDQRRNADRIAAAIAMLDG